jgi:hypothetical protein
MKIRAVTGSHFNTNGSTRAMPAKAGIQKYQIVTKALGPDACPGPDPGPAPNLIRGSPG